MVRQRVVGGRDVGTIFGVCGNAWRLRLRRAPRRGRRQGDLGSASAQRLAWIALANRGSCPAPRDGRRPPFALAGTPHDGRGAGGQAARSDVAGDPRVAGGRSRDHDHDGGRSGSSCMPKAVKSAAIVRNCRSARRGRRVFVGRTAATLARRSPGTPCARQRSSGRVQ